MVRLGRLEGVFWYGKGIVRKLLRKFGGEIRNYGSSCVDRGSGMYLREIEKFVGEVS